MKKSPGFKILFIIIGLIALISSPRLISGVLFLGQASRYSLNGDYSSAASSYSMAAQRLPWMAAIWEQAGEAARLAGDTENEIQYLNQAATRGVLSKPGWLDLGRAYQQRGDMPSAKLAWQRALPLADAYAALAQADQNEGDFQSAIADWQGFLTQQPEAANGHYHLGLLYAATSLDQALPELIKASQLNPSLEQKIQSIRTALNTAFLSTDTAYQYLVAGQALASLGEWDLATEAFENSLQINAEYAEAWAWLGLASQHQGQDASTDFEKAISLKPDSAMVQGLYGTYLLGQGKLKEALSVYQVAAGLEPKNPAWQMALGNVQEQTGDLVKAYSSYSKAVDLAPSDPTTWRALATFSVNNIVDVENAGMPSALKLIDLLPDDWRSYDLAGQASFLLYDYGSAKVYLLRAIQIDPTQAAPSLHLGIVSLQIGDLSSALTYLKSAKSLDPDGTYGWQAGRLLEQYFP